MRGQFDGRSGVFTEFCSLRNCPDVENQASLLSSNSPFPPIIANLFGARLPGQASTPSEAFMPGRMFALTFLVCLGLSSGCQTPLKSDKSDSDLAPPSRGSSSPGFTDQEDEAWSKIGRQMRGDAPVPQQTFDPLRDLMESPRAQSIDRSLGVDD
jgi:hypothetical protein